MDSDQAQKLQLIKTTYTTKELSEITGLKVNTINLYVSVGALVPDVDEGGGRGTRRLFSARNLLEATIIEHLMFLGLTQKIIVQCIKSIHKSFGQFPTFFALGNGTLPELSDKTENPMEATTVYLVFKRNPVSKVMEHNFIRIKKAEPQPIMKNERCAIVIDLGYIFLDYSDKISAASCL